MAEPIEMPTGAQGLEAESAAESGDPSQLLRQAERLESAGQLADAELLYRRLVRAHPDNAGLLHNFGVLMLERGALDEAESVLLRAVSLDPGQAALRNTLGTVFHRQGRYADAGICYQKALELQPGYADPHFNLGALHEELGRPAEALLEYHLAVSKRPHYARALTRIGDLLDKQGAPEEALAQLDRAVQAGTHFFDAHYHRGSVLSRLGRHEEALSALSQASALRPGSLETLIATAHAFQSAGRNDDALATWWKALEMQPAAAATHEEINSLAWSAGRADLYLRSFEYARQRLGLDPGLLRLEAAFRLRNGQFGQAEKLLWQAYSKAPERGDVMGLMARAIAGQGRFEEAYALFSRAIGAEPEVMVHRQEFGLSLLRDAQAKEAQDVFEEALARDPADQIALAGLAAAYRQLGDGRYHALMDPRYIRTYDIKPPAGFVDTKAFNLALAQELRSLHTTRVEPVNQSLRGGTQTVGDLFDSPGPPVQRIKEALQEAIADYIRDLPQDPLHPAARRRAGNFDFSGSWSCQLDAQGFHANHVHPKGWISSAYYAALPSGLDDQHRRLGWLKFGESNLGLGEDDRPDSFVQPMIGRLVLFPSFFWHGTVPFDDAGKRLTIAFDVVPRPPSGAGLPD